MQEVIDFLSGKSDAVIDRLTEQMNKAAREMRFEQAAQLRDRIRDAQNLMERQKAINVNGRAIRISSPVRAIILTRWWRSSMCAAVT